MWLLVHWVFSISASLVFPHSPDACMTCPMTRARHLWSYLTYTPPQTGSPHWNKHNNHYLIYIRRHRQVYLTETQQSLSSNQSIIILIKRYIRSLNPKVHSPLFAAVLLLLQPIHFIGGRLGLPAIGFKRKCPYLTYMPPQTGSLQWYKHNITENLQHKIWCTIWFWLEICSWNHMRQNPQLI